MADSHRLQSPRKILVRDLNESLTCSLCNGYYIDATTLVDCLHSFCRACIVRHFESSKMCPTCVTMVHKSKPLSALRSDPILQSLVYKLVPALYSKELQRRADFYHSTSFRANSSCSDDSVLGDGNPDNEEWILSKIGDTSLYFSPDDSISLSLEYYKPEEDNGSDASSDSDKVNNNVIATPAADSKAPTTPIAETNTIPVADIKDEQNADKDEDKEIAFRRYLQCPAAVTMSHIMKFLRMKYALTPEHRVDIIYQGEVLPHYFSLMDVAYTFNWKRSVPMRFLYRIFMPVVRPIPPVFTAPAPPPLTLAPAIAPASQEPVVESAPKKRKSTESEEPEVPAKSKERKEITAQPQTALVASEPKVKETKCETARTEHVKAPPAKVEPVKIFTAKAEGKAAAGKTPASKTVKFEDPCESARTMPKYKVDSLKVERKEPPARTYEDCVYDYTEPDKEEVKAFAERRDREWAMQKHADTEVYVSKKRKKNKHSKNEFMHKKRKLHAEITSNEVLTKPEDSLKLKVKLSVANGHKHRHRSSSSNSSNASNASNSAASNGCASAESARVQELSPKERLLQMRQVRHKNVPATEDKAVRAATAPALPAEDAHYRIVPPDRPEETSVTAGAAASAPVTPPAPPKLSPERPPDTMLSAGKTLRSDFSFKTSISKDICNKYVTVNVEKCAEHKNQQQNNQQQQQQQLLQQQQQQKKLEVPVKTEKKLPEKKVETTNVEPSKPKSKNGENKSIERAVSRLVEAKREQREEARKVLETARPVDKKSEPSAPSNSGQIVTKNFTVSKVEVGAKRKAVDQQDVDKRPSLEITLINPPPVVTRPTPTPVSAPAVSSAAQTAKTTTTPSSEPKATKSIRPPPPTIPLARIQKSLNLKSGISIIPKASERCDNIGALDLTKAKTPTDGKADKPLGIMSPKTPLRAGASAPGDPCKDPTKLYSEKAPNISNLQMLSESAVQILMAKNGGSAPPVPNLIKKSPQTLKIPSVPQQAQLKAGAFAHKAAPTAAGVAVAMAGYPPHSKPPNLIPKDPLLAKAGFTAKSLHKLPKLNEINKSQFCRMAGAPRTGARPAPNQSIRNIPNPSLLVRQQNQNRINSLVSGTDHKPAAAFPGKQPLDAAVAAVAAATAAASAAGDDRKPTSDKPSEPPALKAIDTQK